MKREDELGELSDTFWHGKRLKYEYTNILK